MNSPESDKGGRPAIGPKVPVNFPADLLQLVDGLAAEAGTTRAAWIRRAVARAALETYERHINPGEWQVFLTLFGRLSNDEEVGAAFEKLHAAVADDAIEQGIITIQSRERRTATGYRRGSLVTRELKLHGKHVTMHQIVEARVTYADNLSDVAPEGSTMVHGWLVESPTSALEFYEAATEGMPS